MILVEGNHVSQAHRGLTSERLLASRDWIRLFAVVGAVAADIAVLAAASALAAYLRFGTTFTGNAAAFLALIGPAYLLASFTFHGYSLDVLRRGARSALRAELALLTATGFAFTAAFALGVSDRLSRLDTGYMLLAAAILLFLARLLGSIGLRRLRRVIEPITFILGDETADAYSSQAHRSVNIRPIRWQPRADDPDFVDSFCRTFRYADRVLLLFHDPRERAAWAGFMQLTGLNAELVEPQLAPVVPTGIGRWGDSPTIVISRGRLTLPERVIKRLFDLTLTLLAVPVALPLVAVLALMIKLESRGPCLFVQDRVGRKNLIYRCYKLRTMRVERADPTGQRSTSRDDDRITPLGRFLRRTSLDELPQLWNVLIGNMSFVGPRPHALGSTAEGKFFWQIVPGYWTRHAMKPGLTGLAQVRGLRGATSSRSDVESRVAADLEYLNTWSIWLDMKILLKTPLVMIHRNAF